MSATSEKITELLRSRTQAATPEGAPALQIPPNVFLDAEGEFISLDEDTKTMVVRFPVLARYRNPLGYMQGGVLGVLADNTMGPLSYIIAPPSVTTTLNTAFIRPVTPNEPYVDVKAWVTEQTRRQLFMTAHVMNADGKLLAIVHATCTIIGEN